MGRELILYSVRKPKRSRDKKAIKWWDDKMKSDNKFKSINSNFFLKKMRKDETN